MRDDHGQFIVIDGIAGSGKSTLIRAIKKRLEKKGMRIFDLAQWAKEQKEPPKFSNIQDFDVYFTFEPTKSWVGAAIRKELSHGDYSGTTHAHAFAMDREIHYKRLVIPALKAGKTIIQDRSVSSSIVYQPIMKHGLELDDLLALPGNALTMQYAPDHLIITYIDPEKLQQRLEERDDDSKGIYENIDFLQSVNKRFSSDWFCNLFTARGTSVHHFSTDRELKNMQQSIQIIITSMLSKTYG